MKPLVIYHDNCADGFGAAWAAYKKFGADGAEYLPMNYNDPRVAVSHDELSFPTAVADRDIYVLDFSFPNPVMSALHNACLNSRHDLIVRDHHKTHFEALDLDPTKLYVYAFIALGADILLDPDRSGCVLAWDFFFPNTPAPTMLHYIQDRDLWRWRFPETRDFAAALRSEPFTFGYFDRVSQDPGPLLRDGRAMNKLFDQQLADIIARPVPVDIQGYHSMGLAVNCTPQFASEAGNKLAEKSGTFGMTWVVGSDGRVFVSLRSIGEFDVSAIARQYGGGGHLNSAGFSVPLTHLAFDGGRLIVAKEVLL